MSSCRVCDVRPECARRVRAPSRGPLCPFGFQDFRSALGRSAARRPLRRGLTRSKRPSTWQQRRVSNGTSTQGMLSTRLKQPGPAQSSYGKRKQANRPWRAPSYPTMVMVHVTTPRRGWNQSFKRFKAACNQPTSPKPQPPSPTIPTCKPSPTNL